MRYAVIMAGGAGKRLWPMSRQNRPKQLLPLIGGKTLLNVAVERLNGLFNDDKILIVTNDEYADQVAAAVPQVPAENVIGEPQGRDTAAAIALGAQLLAARDDDATMAVFTADHVIRPLEEFVRCVGLTCELAEKNPDALVTFGIRPTWPHTGLGYIQCGSDLKDGVCEVSGFKEKPEHKIAREYVDSGRHFWNSGMFVWRVEAILNNLREFLPDTVRKLDPIRDAAAAGKDIAPLLKDIYPTLEKISIDYAVMEKAPRVLMVELTCEWLDVGHWPALADVLDGDDSGNVIVSDNAVVMDCNRNVIVSEDDHLLAVVGMDDCIVVHVADATLVCNKADSQRLKELVNVLEKKHGDRYS